MSATIIPNNGQTPGQVAQPKKKLFGSGANRAFTQDNSKVGVYVGESRDGLAKNVERIATGEWFKGNQDDLKLMELYYGMLTGEQKYKGTDHRGASFGFIGHLARRMPNPILFDDPKIAEFIFGNNKPTAAVDTSGRMWMYGGFFNECIQEETRGKKMVLPLMIHEVLHIALNHTKRMHNFPPDISNIAKDKVINPMARKMFKNESDENFSDIFRFAHGNAPEDKRFEGQAEETIAKQMMIERRKMLEDKGTIKIKNLIIEDGQVGRIKKLSAGKDEIKEYDTIVVKVQDMGMMDRIDTEFDCANLEIENIDNRLKVRRRKGMSGQDSGQQQDSPIEIPTESDDPSQGQGQGQSQGNGQSKTQQGSGGGQGKAQQDQDTGPQSSDTNNQAGRKSLEDITKGMSGNQNQGQGQQSNDPGQTNGQGQQGNDPAQGQGAGQSQQGPGQSGQSPSGQGNQSGGQGSQPNGQQNNLPAPGGNGQGQGQGRPDADLGTKQGDPNAGGVNSGPGSFSGSVSDLLGSLINGNPLDSEHGHEVDLNKLNEYLKSIGYESLTERIRADDFDEGRMDRIVEVSLKEAEKEKLLIGSGYAGGHVDDYIHTVVRPNSIYEVHWEQKVKEFIQNKGNKLTSTLEEYGIYTYLDPEDLGMGADEGVYFPGHIHEKPDGAIFVILDTSGSIWADKVRMGHLTSFALGLKATKGDFSPDVYIVGADTVMSGSPQFYTEDDILDAVETGVPLCGGGGTDYTTPINQTMAWCQANDVKPLGMIYLGDFEVSPPAREALPDNLPPMMFGGMPHDVARAETFIKSVRTWAEVFTIENGISLDVISAQQKSDLHQGVGHNKLAP